MRFFFVSLMVLIGCESYSNGTGGAGAGGGGSGGSGGAAGGAGGSGGATGGSGGATGGAGGSGGATGGSGGAIPPNCGDGQVDLSAGEECDDMNTTPGDGCSAACTIEAAPTCGDGTLDLANGEECDDDNNVAGDGCSPTCQFELVGATCGNGQPEGLEVCDDGNLAGGDACNPTCNFKNTTTLFAGQPPPAPGGYQDGNAIGQALFNGSAVLAVDDQHLYVGEEMNRRVRRIDVATGVVTTLAGNGQQGAADNVVGTSASFGSLEAIGTDGLTLWVGDGANHVIRAVSLTPPHAVTTVAGTAGVAGTADGVGAAAGLDGVRGLTFYGGLVYFVDPNQGTLRSFDPVTQQVTTLAGSPGQLAILDGVGASARLHSPRYMASDNSGILYFAENLQNMLRSYNTVTGEVKGFIGTAGACGHVDGVGAAALVNRPRGLTSDGTSLYWVEFNAHTIRQAVAATGQSSTMIGTPSACSVNCSCGGNNPGGYAEGVGAAAALDLPFSIAFHWPSNSLFFHDSANHVIRRIQ